jgi:hypothetical protein
VTDRLSATCKSVAAQISRSWKSFQNHCATIRVSPPPKRELCKHTRWVRHCTTLIATLQVKATRTLQYMPAEIFPNDACYQLERLDRQGFQLCPARTPRIMLSRHNCTSAVEYASV